MHAHLLSGLQIDAAAAEGGRALAGGHDVVGGDGAALDGLDDQQQGHDLGHAGGKAGVAGVLLKEDRAGLLLHQHGGRRGHRQTSARAGNGGGGGQSREQKQQQNNTHNTFHDGQLLCA